MLPKLRRALPCLASLGLLALAASAPAGAHAVGAEPQVAAPLIQAPPPGRLDGVPRGVVYRRNSAGARAARQRLAADCTVSCAGPLVWRGGPVMHSHKTYTIYWAPPVPEANGQLGTSFIPFPTSPVNYKTAIDTFLTNVAADSGRLSNVYSVDQQYGEPAAGVYSSAFGATFDDADLYPPRDKTNCPVSSNGGADGLPPAEQPCLTNEQIVKELETFIAAHPVLKAGLESIYFVLTPQHVNSCAQFFTGVGCNTNAFCAYHSNTGALSPIVYADMPYDHVPGCEAPAEPNGSPADDEINTLSHEHNEAVTDPTGGGWLDGGENEVGDKCTFPFFDPVEDSNPATDAYGPLLGGSSGSTAYNQEINGGHYLLQREWSNAAGGCVTQAPVPVASFAAYSNPAVAGRPVAFNGSASSPSAGSITRYVWSFGDGSPAAEGAEVAHTYTQAGRFSVTLTVTNDSGASDTSAPQTVTVEEPSSSGTTTITTTTVAPPPPPQVITNTITAPAPATPAPRALTASQLAGLIGLPVNGARLRARGRIALGRSRCPPACSVAVRLYALLGATAHHRRLVRRVPIGTLTVRGSGALALSLSQAGAGLLRAHHRLAASLSVTVLDREGGSWRIARRLTLVR